MFRLLHQKSIDGNRAYTYSMPVSQHVVYNAQQKLKWMPAELFVSSLSFLRLVSFDLSKRHKIRLKSVFLIFIFLLCPLRSYGRSRSRPLFVVLSSHCMHSLIVYSLSFSLSISVPFLHSYHSTHRYFFFHSSWFVFVVVFVFVVIVVDRS